MSSIKKSRKIFITTIIVLFFVVILLFFVSMCVGRYQVSTSDVYKYFTFQTIDSTSKKVIENLRIPRTLLALLIGAALSISGSIYQSAFNNKLVSPDLLGVSSGSSVGACIGLLLGLSSGFVTGLSFVTGIIVVALSVGLSKVFKTKGNITLLLSGIAIGGLMSSLVGLMKYLADNDSVLAEMTYWLLGSLASSTYKEVIIMTIIFLVFGTISLIFSWKLNIVSLGRKESKTLGVNYYLVMGVLIVAATVLTAGSVSVSGVIGWVGLVIPNIVRLLVGSDNRKVIPYSMLSGAIFVMIVDMLALYFP